MTNGCLFALFGLGRGNGSPPSSRVKNLMGEGDIHSGPAGYEGMGYSGGYAANYRAQFDESESPLDEEGFAGSEH